MKNSLLALSLSKGFLICISILIPAKLYAVDITVGATTWYAKWDAKYTGNTKATNGGIVLEHSNISTDPTFLYGPVLSLKFNEDFNLTFVYLYGEFDQYDYGTITYGNVGNQTTYTKYKRRDLDLALNYKLNDYLKLFTGIKYMAYKAEFSGKSVYNNGDYYICTGYKEPGAYGPGLGLNATLPVIENLFILGTLSGFYLWGKEKGRLEIIDVNIYPFVFRPR